LKQLYLVKIPAAAAWDLILLNSGYKSLIVKDGVMLVPNFQFYQNLDSHTRKHLVGYPAFPFGHNKWSPFTRCKPKGIDVKSIQFGHVLGSTEHSEADRLNIRAAQQSPVEEPPNQPK
jgi:hypothetical protein